MDNNVLLYRLVWIILSYVAFEIVWYFTIGILISDFKRAHKALANGEYYWFYKYFYAAVIDSKVNLCSKRFYDIFLKSDYFDSLSDEDKIKKCTAIFARFAYISSIYSKESLSCEYLTDIDSNSFCYVVVKNMIFPNEDLNKGEEEFKTLYKQVVNKSFMEVQKTIPNSVS